VFDFVKWEGRIKAGRKSGAKRRKKATSGERGAGKGAQSFSPLQYCRDPERGV
jgi:hypothetical protein